MCSPRFLIQNIYLAAKQEAKQQYAERQVEKFDRLAKYSLDKENKDKYGAKYDAWSKIANSSSPIQAIKSPSEHSSKTLNKYIGASVVKSRDSDIIKVKDNKQRNMANGQRRSPLYILKDDEISVLSREAESINIPLSCLSFNTGSQTGFIERTLIINSTFPADILK